MIAPMDRDQYLASYRRDSTALLDAIRAYEKAGFKREGLLREHGFSEGRHVDEVLMGVLRSEKP